MSSYSMACTNFIVGKDASADGSVICTYNADDYGMFQNLCHYPAAKHAPGEMRKVYDWDTNKYHGEIPEASETYNVIGNINEYDTIFIGFPIWYYGAPNIINTFVKSYDLSAKKILLFATSGGSDIGKTADKIKPLVPVALNIVAAKLFQPGDSEEELRRWAESIL